MEDRLLVAAKFFADNLEGKKFKLIAQKKGKTIELYIVFSAEHFKHLAGLHKLEDLPISKRDSANIYKEILDSKITLTDIMKSRFFSQVDERIECFYKIKDALFSPNLMLKSLKGYFLGVSADFLLTQIEDKTNYFHLFLKEDKELVSPITFFVRCDDKYIRNTIRWSVLSIEEIKVNEEVKKPEKEVKEEQTKVEQVQPKKVVKKIEIEPLRVYKIKENGDIIVRVPGKKPEDPRKIIKLPQNCVTLDKYREYVVATTAEIQKHYGFQISDGQSHRVLK